MSDQDLFRGFDDPNLDKTDITGVETQMENTVESQSTDAFQKYFQMLCAKMDQNKMELKADIKADMENLTLKVDSFSKELHNLNNQVETNVDSIKTCENRVDRVEQNYNELKQNLINTNSEQNQLKEIVDGQGKIVAASTTEIENCWVKVNESIRGVQVLEIQVNNVEENLGKTIEHTFSQSPIIGKHLENLRNEVKGVRQECKTLCETKLKQFCRQTGNQRVDKGGLGTEEILAFERAVPKFFADHRGPTPIQFIHKCERMLNSLGGSDEQQIQLLVSRLGGEALQWAGWKESEWTTFSECKTAFLHKYWGVYVQDDFLQFVFAGRYRPGDGSMANYVQNLHLQSKYLDNGMSEDRFISHITHHFTWAIQNCILGSRSKTVEELISLLESLDRREEREEGLGRRGNVPGNRGPQNQPRNERNEQVNRGNGNRGPPNQQREERDENENGNRGNGNQGPPNQQRDRRNERNEPNGEQAAAGGDQGNDRPREPWQRRQDPGANRQPLN